ncbi:MAG: hypothetical protein GXY01_10115 [Clostridiales bacterium]|nr:hypothetical protein [Clostridiales bacterium]
MSSTNKTPNLRLNQWVLTDPLLMEDMNEDNRKIDSTISKIPFSKLMDIKTTADAQQVDIDVSQIDLTQYSMIQIYTDAQVMPKATGQQIYVRINNLGGYCSNQTNQNLENSSRAYLAFCNIGTTPSVAGSMRIDIMGLSTNDQSQSSYIYVHSEGAFYSNGFYATETYGVRVLSGNDKVVKSINFLCSSSTMQIIAGTRFIVYGVRK